MNKGNLHMKNRKNKKIRQDQEILRDEHSYLADHMKLLLIFGVVLGNAMSFKLKEASLLSRYLWYCVSLFHTASFVCISGYFSKKPQKILRNLEHLIVPCLIGYILTWTAYYMVGDIHKFNLFTLGGSIVWYLPVIFLYRMLIPVWTKVKPVPLLICMILAGLGIGLIAPARDLALLIKCIVLFPFFAAGYYWKSSYTRKLRKWKNKWIFPLLFLWALAVIPPILIRCKMDARFFQMNWGYRQIGLSNAGGLGIRCMMFITAILAAMTFLGYLPDRKTHFSVLGQRTLDIHVLHYPFLIILNGFGFWKWVLKGKNGLAVPAAIVISILLIAGISFFHLQNPEERILKLPDRRLGTSGIINLLLTIPGIMLVTVWTMLVHVQNLETKLADKPWFNDIQYQNEYFLYIRANAVIILAICMIPIILYLWIVRKYRISWKVLILAGLLTICTLISTWASLERDFSLTGVFEQYETVWVLLAYYVIMLYFMLLVQIPSGWKTCIKGLLAGGFMQGLIGVSQILGHDFWATPLGNKLILLGTGQDLHLIFHYASEEDPRIYLSFYNPNYVGVYCVMILPIAIGGFFYAKERIHKQLCGVIGILMLACIWFSQSRAALITLAGLLILLIFMVFTNRKLKFTLLLLAVGGMVVGVNLMTLLPDTFVQKKLVRSFFPKEVKYRIKGFDTQKDYIKVKLNNDVFYMNVEKEDGQYWFRAYPSKKDEPYKILTENDFFRIDDERLEDISFKAEVDKKTKTFYINCYYKDCIYSFKKKKGESYKMMNSLGRYGQCQYIEKALFTGYEKGMSNRFYLWSRSLLKVPKYVWIGSGPNTFTLVFPQNEYVMREHIHLDLQNNVITRPHNFYIQTSLQTGLLSLVFTLSLFGYYFIRAFKKISKVPKAAVQVKRADRVLVCSMILSISGYLVMMLVNDSIPVTAPVFWAILGIGFGILKE